MLVGCDCVELADSNVIDEVAGVAKRRFEEADSCRCKDPTPTTPDTDVTLAIARCSSTELACGGAPPEDYGETCDTTCAAGVIGCDGQCDDVGSTTVPANFGQACTVTCGCGCTFQGCTFRQLNTTIGCSGTCEATFAQCLASCAMP